MPNESQKIRKVTDIEKAKLSQWLLSYEKEKFSRKNIRTLLSEAIEALGIPYPRSTFLRFVKAYGLTPKESRGGSCQYRRSGKERSGLGNARRIMFLARIVKSLCHDMGTPISEMLETLAKGNSLPEDVANTEVSK